MSADIIFHKFLELYSTLYEENFRQNFPFLINSINPPIHPPTPLTAKIR